MIGNRLRLEMVRKELRLSQLGSEIVSLNVQWKWKWKCIFKRFRGPVKRPPGLKATEQKATTLNNYVILGTLMAHLSPMWFFVFIQFFLVIYFWVRQRKLEDFTLDFSILSSLAHIHKCYRCYQVTVSRRHCNEQQRDEHDLYM